MNELVILEKLLNVANKSGAFSLAESQQAINCLSNVSTHINKLESQVSSIEKELDGAIQEANKEEKMKKELKNAN